MLDGDQLKVAERFTRIDDDQLDYEATIDGPEVFTRPWTMTMRRYRHTEPKAQILDYQCYTREDRTDGMTVPLYRESPPMTPRRPLMRRCVSIVTVSLMLLAGAGLWWASHPAAQTADPAVWPTYRPDGQPDVQGIWHSVGPEGGSGLNIEPLENFMNRGRTGPGMVVDPPDGLIPYLPWARVRRDEVMHEHLTPNVAQVDPRTRGWPDGVPRINYYNVNPYQIIQPDGAVVILYETQHEFRYIPLDGRPQPDEGVTLWMGSSRGRWEDTTLVVEVSHIYDRVRLSIAGDFASDALRLTERWHFADANTIEHTTTYEDPNVYTQPWTVAKTIKRITDPGFELMEYSGVEGDKDAHYMVDIAKEHAEEK